MSVTRRLRVTGRVQGIWYRGWTVEAARALGLAGWVRNRRDGSVEILARGPEEKIAALADRCREGPAAARVERVEVEDAGETVPPTGFVQKPSL